VTGTSIADEFIITSVITITVHCTVHAQESKLTIVQVPQAAIQSHRQKNTEENERKKIKKLRQFRVQNKQKKAFPFPDSGLCSGPTMPLRGKYQQSCNY
jgi:hypothetical protein